MDPSRRAWRALRVESVGCDPDGRCELILLGDRSASHRDALGSRDVGTNLPSSVQVKDKSLQ